MEKYSKFRDEATGIAPFQSARPKSADFDWLQSALSFVFSIVTVPFALASLMFHLLVIQCVLPYTVSSVLLRATVLVPLRVLYTTLTYDGERRASVRKSTLIRAVAGDIVLSNFVSPLDPLVYSSHLKGAFVFPTADGLFERVSLTSAVFRALSGHPPSAKGIPLQQISKDARNAGAVVVIFLEGTSSNGKGLLTLKFVGFHEISLVEANVFPAAIRYTPASAAAPVPATLPGYVWGISRAAWWYIAAIKVGSTPLDHKSLSRDSVGKAVSSIGRLRILGDRLDWQAKLDYVEKRRK